MKNCIYLLMLLSGIFFFTSCESTIESVELDQVEAETRSGDETTLSIYEGFVDDDWAHPELDHFIVTYLEFQGFWACGGGSVSQEYSPLDQLNSVQTEYGGLPTVQYNQALLDLFLLIGVDVPDVFSALSDLILVVGEDNLEALIAGRVYFLLETGALDILDYIPCLPPNPSGQGWGGGCGFWDYAGAIGSGVGALLAVGGAGAAAIGTGGLAAVPAGIGAGIAVAGAINAIGSLAVRCG